MECTVLLYFSIASLGVILLVATAILGEMFDFFGGLDAMDGGASSLSGKVIATAMVAFGAAGMITSYYDWDPLLSAVTSALSAVFLAALAWLLINALHRQTASTDFNVSSATGRVGEVIVGIPSGSVGEILLSTSSGTRHMIARSQDGSAIPAGTSVRIVEARSSIVIVSQLDHLAPTAAAPQGIEG